MVDFDDALDFSEALKDSPRFRWNLLRNQNYANCLESKINEILRHFKQFIEFGHSFINSFQNAIDSMKDINDTCLNDDADVHKTIDTISNVYSEFCKFHKVLIEQAYWSIVKNLTDFLKREVYKVHEMRSHFHRVGQSLDEALVKNSQVSKHKDQEAFEARNELTAVGTCFAHTALDYVFQLNLLRSRQKFEIIEAFNGFLNSCRTFFRQGYDLLVTDSDPSLVVDPTPVVTTLKQQSRIIERKMQDRHMLVPKASEVFQHPPGMPTDPDVVMEGYLFKRATNAFKTWNRRWFVIKDSKLLYCHRDVDTHASGDHKNQNHNQTAAAAARLTPNAYTIMEPDLRLCLVRQAQSSIDRRNCFELVTPTKIHVLQADSESLCSAWIKALQRSIESALHDSSNENTLVLDEACRSANGCGESVPPGGATVGYPNSASMIGHSSSESPKSLMMTSVRAMTPSAGMMTSSAVMTSSMGMTSSLLGMTSCVGMTSSSGGMTSSANLAATLYPRAAKPKKRILDHLSTVPGNDTCADCGAFDPKWASLNLGVTLCIECCAIHRSMGVQVSKVRSLTLDAWEPEHVRLMELLGNDMVNAVYLAHAPKTPVPLPAKPDCSRPVREVWIKAKYLTRDFVNRLPTVTNRKTSKTKKPQQIWATPILQRPVKFGQRKNRAYSTPAEPSPNSYSVVESSNIDKERNLRKPKRRSESAVIDEKFSINNSAPDLFGKNYLSPRANDHHAATDAIFVSGSGRTSQHVACLSSSNSESILIDKNETDDDEVKIRLPQNLRLLKASKEADLKLMCECLAKNADVNFSCQDHRNSTPLHEAVTSGSLEACEYLLLNGAKINVQDVEGRTPLHLACQLGHTAQVCQLLKRGANQDVTTLDGKTALDIAMDSTNADIVTLLRLAKLNEEIKETDVTNPGDETFADVVRDFSHIASNRPEILKRNTTPSSSKTSD